MLYRKKGAYIVKTVAPTCRAFKNRDGHSDVPVTNFCNFAERDSVFGVLTERYQKSASNGLQI